MVRKLLQVLVGLLVLVTALPAMAQITPAWNVQSWRPGLAPDDGLTTKSALVPAHLDGSAFVTFGYARSPLVLQNSAVGAKQTLVGDLGTVEFGGGFGLWDRGFLGASLPVAAVIRGGGDNLAQINPPKPPTLGNMRLDGRFALWTHKADDHSLHLGLAGVVELPTAARGSMMGGTWTGGVEALATLVFGAWQGNVNVGVRGASTQVLQVHAVDASGLLLPDSGLTTIARSGSVWLARAGARRGLFDDMLGLRAELQAQGTLLTNALPTGPQVVLDLLAGVDVRFDPAWRLFAMAGGAPTSAMGSAGVRVAAGIAFDDRGLNRDHDGDGILDNDDKCPDDAEDRDGFEDADGCPDLDDDADGIGDTIDQCPRVPEDRDGYQDADGCPDPDNDGDGVPDGVDKCPLVAEDLDNFEDADGCPELDNDKDGIPDVDDLCPSSPETKNGFEDGDGCPDQLPVLPKVEPPPPPPKVEAPKVEAPKPLTKKEKAALAKKAKAEKAAAAKQAKADKLRAKKAALAEKKAAAKAAKALKSAGKHKASGHHAGTAHHKSKAHKKGAHKSAAKKKRK